MKSNGMLILVRHGQSEWNKKNLFTGWKDPDLTKKGVQEANSVGKLLLRKKIKFHTMFTSDLIRAQKTGEIILKILNQQNIETISNKALNERDYGDLSGLNKDEANRLKNSGFKLCFVSPELQGREKRSQVIEFRHQIEQLGIKGDAVCTKYTDLWS